MNRLNVLLATSVLLSSVLIAAPAAEAQSRGDRYAPKSSEADYVVAESRFGHGTVAGFVRPGARGVQQVRLPGGTWIDCRRSCSETLRVESIDFWENRGAGRHAIDNECGVFGCLSRGFRF